MPRWGEEGKKLFTFQRRSYRNSSPAHDAEKKPFEWKFSEMKAAPLLAAAVADCRQNSLSSQHKAKWISTVCSQIKSMVHPEDQFP